MLKSLYSYVWIEWALKIEKKEKDDDDDES